ncbi:MAG TPA: surface-adhesin E family protein [Pyrinomonadaceae bacterium]|nr:surface-adhesin E family protein [Pyrinomonadaceae bacterium]
MKRVLAALALFLWSSTLSAQQPQSEWQRVYTFDESVIDVKTTEVITIFGERGRVTFRWSFDKPEPLVAGARLKYSSRLEVIEFDCRDERYRPYQLTFFDAAGRVLASEEARPGEPWSEVSRASMTGRLYTAACQLITPHRQVFKPVSDEEVETEKVETFARSFRHSLEEKRDFGPLVKEFFVPDYLGGYLRESETNWFLTLDPAVAASVSRAELQRYHVALMNLAYLSATYFVGRDTEDSLVTRSVADVVRHHPYTTAYRGAKGGLDYLTEKIDSPARLRRYTELLESSAALFRRNLQKAESKRTNTDDLVESSSHPQSWVCSRECFNLPAGTKLFEVSVPVFRLQIAELNGELKIVSALPHFQ